MSDCQKCVQLQKQIGELTDQLNRLSHSLDSADRELRRAEDNVEYLMNPDVLHAGQLYRGTRVNAFVISTLSNDNLRLLSVAIADEQALRERAGLAPKAS